MTLDAETDADLIAPRQPARQYDRRPSETFDQWRRRVRRINAQKAAP